VTYGDVGASHCGHVKVVKLLLAVSGIEVARADELGRTPLATASIMGHTKVVTLLVKRPAGPTLLGPRLVRGVVPRDAAASLAVLGLGD